MVLALALLAPGAALAKDVCVVDVRIGVVGHTMGPFDPFGGNSVLVSILGDAAFAGEGFYDSNGDFVPDAAATWTSVECSVALNPT